VIAAAALVALVSAAAPAPVPDALQSLRPGPPAAAAAVHSAQQIPGDVCRFEQLRVDDPRVRAQWRTTCSTGIASHLAATDRVLAVRTYSNEMFHDPPVLAFSDAAASDVRHLAPAWVPAGLVEKVRQPALPAGVPAWFIHLATDPRDGSLAGRDRSSFLRMVKGDQRWTSSSLFPADAPVFSRAWRSAMAFGPGQREPAPWLLFLEDAGKLWLRSPAGGETLLFSGPGVRGVGEGLSMVFPRPGSPVVSALSRGAWLVFTPRGGTYLGRTFGDTSAAHLPHPYGERSPVRPSGPACPETVSEDVAETPMSPVLQAYQGHVVAVFLDETTRSGLHLGVVPRAGATPAEDTYGCEWILDTRESSMALVVGEVLESGVLEERVRVPLERNGSLRNLVTIEGDFLWVASTTERFTAVTRFDLARLFPSR